MSALLPDDKLSVCVDFSSLSCYVALSGTRQLADEFGIEINWLPLIKLSSRKTGKVQTDDPLGEYKARRARARKMFSDRELERDSALLGIMPNAGAINYDTKAVAEGLLWLRESDASQPRYWEYVEAIFSAAFRDQQPVESTGQVEMLMAKLELGLAKIENASEKLTDLQEDLTEAGVFDSPTFIIGGERFLGRQHFPLLSWMLKGKIGPPPV